VITMGSEWEQQMVTKIRSERRQDPRLRNILLAPLYNGAAPVIGGNEEMETFSDQGFGFEFKIAPNVFYPEVQTSRLMNYLCTFDPRAKPLMAVIVHWAKINGVRLGGEGAARIGFSPDPALLEWLVLFFLGSDQVKLVPSPKEVFKRHDSKLLFEGVNIGFQEDAEYAQTWRIRYDEKSDNQIIKDVYELARQFFRYCCKLGERAKNNSILINLNNFNFVSKSKMDKCVDKDDLKHLSSVTRVSPLNLKLINANPLIRKGFYSRSEAVTVLHPLHVHYGFSFGPQTFVDSVCSKMQVTEEKLRKFQETQKRNGDGGKKNAKKQESINIESVFRV